MRRFLSTAESCPYCFATNTPLWLFAVVTRLVRDASRGSESNRVGEKDKQIIHLGLKSVLQTPDAVFCATQVNCCQILFSGRLKGDLISNHKNRGVY